MLPYHHYQLNQDTVSIHVYVYLHPNDLTSNCLFFSAVSEWLIALSFIFFILSFVEEFKIFKLYPPHVPVQNSAQSSTSGHRGDEITETVHELDENQIQNRLFRYAIKKGSI